MIDSELFKKMYKEIDKKVQKIRVLPMLYRQEQDYDGFDIYDDEIYINSSYWTQGCGEDTSVLCIPIDEIENSIDFFKQKFQNEIDDDTKKQEELKKIEKQRVLENRLSAKEKRAKEDMATYRRIKKKLENKSNKL